MPDAPSSRAGAAGRCRRLAQRARVVRTRHRARGSGASEEQATDAAARRPLALQFELRRRVPRRRGEWQGPRDEPARRATSVDRLAVRPVTAGARGGWIKAGLTWQNIAYQASAGGFDPVQSRWFAQFALLKGSSPGVYQAYGSEWITLDEFESPLLWALLAEAGRLGIALAGSDVTPDVSRTGAGVGRARCDRRRRRRPRARATARVRRRRRRPGRHDGRRRRRARATGAITMIPRMPPPSTCAPSPTTGSTASTSTRARSSSSRSRPR